MYRYNDISFGRGRGEMIVVHSVARNARALRSLRAVGAFSLFSATRLPSHGLECVERFVYRVVGRAGIYSSH